MSEALAEMKIVYPFLAKPPNLPFLQKFIIINKLLLHISRTLVFTDQFRISRHSFVEVLLFYASLYACRPLTASSHSPQAIFNLLVALYFIFRLPAFPDYVASSTTAGAQLRQWGHNFFQDGGPPEVHSNPIGWTAFWDPIMASLWQGFYDGCGFPSSRLRLPTPSHPNVDDEGERVYNSCMVHCDLWG